MNFVRIQFLKKKNIVINQNILFSEPESYNDHNEVKESLHLLADHEDIRFFQLQFEKKHLSFDIQL